MSGENIPPNLAVMLQMLMALFLQRKSNIRRMNIYHRDTTHRIFVGYISAAYTHATQNDTEIPIFPVNARAVRTLGKWLGSAIMLRHTMAANIMVQVKVNLRPTL